LPRRDSLAFVFALGAAGAGAFAGCRCQNGGSEGEARLPAGIPVASSVIASVLNPGRLARYEGPVGTVQGVVRVDGDPPPASSARLSPPPSCPEAQATYQSLFRKGPAGELADAVVGVTNYPGYLLPHGDAVNVSIRGCAFSARTLTLTFGQRLEITNEDPREKYMPRLDGAGTTALIAAMPKGDAVKLYPLEPGRFSVADELNHPWMRADLFVLKYPAHTVSAADGSFRIEGVPAGKVRVNAGHPAIIEGTSREIEIKAGDVTKVELVLTYHAATPAPPHNALPPGAALPGSASAPASASAP
jgi:hypothetical protein